MKEITEEELIKWEKKIQNILIKWEANYFEGYKTVEYILKNGKVIYKVI